MTNVELLDRLNEQIDRMRTDMELLQQDVIAKNREIARLKAEQTKQRRDKPEYHQARELFDYWVTQLGKRPTVVYGEKRETTALAMLKHFSVDDLKKSIDGCKMKPYVGPHGRVSASGQGAKRHDEFSLILRDETTVERFMAYVDEYQEAMERIRGQSLERGKRALIERNGRDYDDPDMPRAYPDALRRVLAALGDRDLDVDGTGGRYMAQCPSHDDRSPSLSIVERPDGAVLFNCFAGCDMLKIARDLGLDWHGLWGSSYGRAA